MALAGARMWILRRYDREVVHAGPDEHIAFFRRYQLVWRLSAFLWGGSTLLYFDRSAMTDQFICWLSLAGVAM